MPFRDARGSGNLATRIAAEVRERLEEAIDAACLDTMVRAREARGLPPPAADNARDRHEYAADIRALLERLRAHFEAALTEDLRHEASGAERTADVPRLMAVQAVLARSVPDYWQQFDTVRQRYVDDRCASSGQGRGGLFGRLFGRG